MNKNFSKQNTMSPEALAAVEAAKALKAKADKRKVEIKVGERTYVINKWTHGEVLDRLPDFGRVFVVPMAVVDEIDEQSSQMDYTAILFNNLSNMEYQAWIDDCLAKVTLKGKDTPVDKEEDFDSILDIFTVVEEVLRANFMLPLCQRMLTMAPVLGGVSQIAQSVQPSKE